MKKLGILLLILISSYSVSAFAEERFYQLSQGKVNLDLLGKGIASEAVLRCKKMDDSRACKIKSVYVESMRVSYDPLMNLEALGQLHIHVAHLKVNQYQVSCNVIFFSDNHEVSISDCVSSTMSDDDLIDLSLVSLKYKEIGL